MICLTLLRHADAVHDSRNDHARALSDRGISQARYIAEWLASSESLPDAIHTSNATRAVQTADMCSAAIAANTAVAARSVMQHDELYLATSAALLRFLDSLDWRTSRHLLLVGHNPGIADLVMSLAKDAPRSMPTAALRQLSMEPDESGGVGGAIGLARLTAAIDPPISLA